MLKSSNQIFFEQWHLEFYQESSENNLFVWYYSENISWKALHIKGRENENLLKFSRYISDIIEHSANDGDSISDNISYIIILGAISGILFIIGITLFYLMKIRVKKGKRV